jgi:uncharacterized protein YjiS (DUF1127 family)
MSAIEHVSASTMPNAGRRTPRITVAQLFLRAVRSWQRNRAINELSRLDNRQLEDIGISRNDIPRVVEGLITPEEADAKPAPRVVYLGEEAVLAAESYPRAA